MQKSNCLPLVSDHADAKELENLSILSQVELVVRKRRRVRICLKEKHETNRTCLILLGKTTQTN